MSGAALVTFVLMELLRVWFPSVLFVVGDAGDTSALVMGTFALGGLLVPSVVAVAWSRLRVRPMWLSAATVVAICRLLLLFTDGGAPQAAVSTAGVIAGILALTALAATPVTGQAGRLGILFGLAGAASIHALVGTHDLVWRDGLGAALASVVLVAALALAALAFASELEAGRVSHAPGPAWPWLVVGPLFLLVGILAGVPGRVAVATGWSEAAVALTVVGGQALGVLAALLAPRVGPTVAGAGGAALVLVGTAGALPAVGILAIGSQLLLMLGLGAVVGATPLASTHVSSRRRATALAGGILLGFGIPGFVYYAAYDLPLRISNRSILLVAAVCVALLGGAAARAGLRQPVRPVVDRHRLGRAVVALAVLTLVAGVARTDVPSPRAAIGGPDEPIRVALYNLHMGFDPEGRFSVPAMADVLRREAPDIVVLNEVDRGWLTTGGHDILRMLAAELELTYHFARAADEVWGNALLTRFPVDEFLSERLPRGGDAMARSQFVAVLTVAPQRQLAVLGTHLSHVDAQGDTRLPQARAVAANVAMLRDRGLPTIVMGDLNAEPNDPELVTLESLLVSAVPEGIGTWPSWEPDRQIDHILISPDLRARDVSVPQVTASDHLPLAVTLDPPPAAAGVE